MDKKISECTALELLNNFSINKGNSYYLKVIDVINAMHDYLKSQPQIKGHELELLNESFKQLKPRLDKVVLEQVVHIERS